MRTHRSEAPGAIHHVVPKGNGGRLIVEDDMDRRAFLGRYVATIRDYDWIPHAHCLMSTHHHAVLETPKTNLGVGLRRLLGGYSRGFNRRHGRDGSVFSQHCWSRRVADDRWLFRACLYAVLNPVAAGLCAHPREWRLSSYATTAYGDPNAYAVGEERLLRMFGDTPREARAGYVDVVSRMSEGIIGQRLAEGRAVWETLASFECHVSLQVSD